VAEILGRVGAPEIAVRRAAERYLTRTDWVTSQSLFSFGDHYDPQNISFGPLLVCNVDLLAPGPGYAEHPHANAEILTWVLSGTLVHEDSAGNRGVIYPGLAQRMSAGSGIVHAERNDAFRVDPTRPVAPVHFVQTWIRPDEAGLPPSYQQRELDLAAIRHGWVPVASGRHPDAAVTMASAATTWWVSVLAPGTARTLPSAPRLHLYLARGEVEVETQGRLGAGDSLRITGEAPLRLTGVVEAEVLVWEMAT
jgi:redox-sensitive bicupin YhaK (pirin superfamily)